MQNETYEQKEARIKAMLAELSNEEMDILTNEMETIAEAFENRETE